MKQSTIYTIGDLAEITELSRHSIRWYIRKELIKTGQRVGHYRVFDESALRRLNRIKELRRKTQEYPDGIPLAQIRILLDEDPEDNTD